MVRHESSKLKKHNEKSRNLLDDSCSLELELKLAECGLTGRNACMRTAAIASTVLHGNNVVN